MKLRNLRYFLKEAIISLVKNRLMSVASILTVASCVFILTVYFCVAQNISHLLTQLENKAGLTVIISEFITADDVNVLYSRISELPEVRFVKYISEEEALAGFSETMGEDSDLFEALHNDNPLRRSFEIQLYTNRDQAYIITVLENLKSAGVAKVKHQIETIDLFISINNIVSIISGVFTLCLGLISIIIIMNTIKLTVNTRRFEIGIMKYVGATNWFIRWPFVIEGVLIGLIGSSIPVVICFYMYTEVINWVYTFPLLEELGEFISVSVLFSALTPASISIGALMGSLGSVISMRKYLQV